MFNVELTKLSSSVERNVRKLSSQIEDCTNYLKSKGNKSEKAFVSLQKIQDNFNIQFPLKTDDEFQFFENNINKNIMNIKNLLVNKIF